MNTAAVKCLAIAIAVLIPGYACGSNEGTVANKNAASVDNEEPIGDHATLHKTIEVNGLKIFYREAGPKNAPTLQTTTLFNVGSNGTPLTGEQNESMLGEAFQQDNNCRQNTPPLRLGVELRGKSSNQFLPKCAQGGLVATMSHSQPALRVGVELRGIEPLTS